MEARVIWLTGLPGCGNLTLAENMRAHLSDHGVAAAVLDELEIRRGLNRDLGYGEADCRENIRRIAEVARALSRQELVVIVSVVSPHHSHGTLARTIIGASYREVCVDARLTARDAHDISSLDASGRLDGRARFTSFSNHCEAPFIPSLRIDTTTVATDTAIDRLLSLVELPANASATQPETQA